MRLSVCLSALFLIYITFLFVTISLSPSTTDMSQCQCVFQNFALSVVRECAALYVFCKQSLFLCVHQSVTVTVFSLSAFLLPFFLFTYQSVLLAYQSVFPVSPFACCLPCLSINLGLNLCISLSPCLFVYHAALVCVSISLRSLYLSICLPSICSGLGCIARSAEC